MESNGIPNKIHFSEATAEALKAAGKGHWITKRDEMIEAKGKGILQTYFVETPNESRRRNSSGPIAHLESPEVCI
jgi:hypothetical protein